MSAFERITSPDTTVFKSVGIAAEDIAAAMLVYGRAAVARLDDDRIQVSSGGMASTLLARADEVIE